MRAKKIPMLTELSVQAPIQELGFIESQKCGPWRESESVRLSRRCRPWRESEFPGVALALPFWQHDFSFS